MNNKLHNRKTKIGAAAIAIIFLGSVLALPMSNAVNPNINDDRNDLLTKPFEVSSTGDVMAWLDRSYPNENELFLALEQNDMGYNTDAKEKIGQSIPLYVSEPIDQTVPGRGRQGSLDPDNGDKEDWFAFSACEGQNIQASISRFNIEICNTAGSPVGTSYTADKTGTYFVRIYGDGATAGDYTITVTVSGQNDAGTGSDAGNSIAAATPITPGNYDGYMTYTDVEDWYSFSASSGDGIFITVGAVENREGDFDIHLYSPSGELKYYEMYYTDDELEYPADASGTWKFKISQWPGWDTEKWPDNYFLYGSGAYEMSLTVGGSAQSPPGPIPQPQITPIAQTFRIANDPDSSDDEYAFLAAVPAAVYQEGGKQYVSPVVYTGDSTPTSYFGTADDTTQYLLDDWEEYLSHFDFNATVYEVNTNPITAAADIALNGWTASNTAVLAVDGSTFTDTTGILDIDQDATLNVKTEKTVAGPSDLKEFAGNQAVQMWVGKQWGAMTLYLYGSAVPAVGLINMRYESSAYEDWPYPYDGTGSDNTNIYFPVGLPGLYWPYVDSAAGWDRFEITKYSCDRYTVNIDNTDTSIYATVTTTQPSYLEVFLVDPEGLVRRPSIPMWNGGEIQPLHIWNGGHWMHNFDLYRRWEPTLSTEHTVNIHYPSTGKWTVIVTPHYKYGEEKTSDSIPYHITIETREHNPLRTNAGLGAANGAVLASQIHAPLLYVTGDSVPMETQNALDQLGVKEILFVNINDISSAVPSGTVIEINTMQEIINMVQSYKGKMQPAEATSDKIITITSFGSEDGFFAPAGLIAAYHGSNVLNIGEVPDAYNLIDKGTAYRIYSGGWYHGVRAQGHTSKSSEPIPSVPEIIKGILTGDFPPLGLDNDLRWWGGTYDAIFNWVTEKGLTGPGQECYIFVAPRWTDIRHCVITQMMGVGSYAGQFPMDTVSLDAAHISRDILYSALVFANPGKDVTTSQCMNFPDGWQWTCNDGTRVTVFSTREIKQSYSSHGRFYEGHCTWDNWLARMNEGVSINYYSGHGTGGSGVSFQWMNIEEQFPLVEPTHESLKNFNWWDGWRGYMYDDTQTKDPRWGGFTWYNPKEPNVYNLIHYKYIDQYLQNLHSEIEVWMSCTTGQNMGPHIYLEHGGALWFGNAGTGLCPEEDALDDMWMMDMMINGSSVGQAFSKYVWLHQRDFSAKLDNPAIYEASLYGSSSMQVTNVQVLYGDPTLTVCSPEWIEPVPVLP